MNPTTVPEAKRKRDPLGATTALIVKVSTFMPIVTVVLTLALTGLAIWFAATTLRVNSDSSGMLSEDLDFQKRTRDINTAFPLNKNSIVVVISSEIPDAVDAAAKVIVDNLNAGTETIESVFSANVDPFFLRNGLLYQTVEELDAQLYKLNSAASTISYLRENQNLDAFFKALFSAGELASKAEFDPALLDKLYAQVAANVGKRNAGQPQPFSWQSAFDAADEPDPETTRVVMVTPQLDFEALQPARVARAEVLDAVAKVPEAVRKHTEITLTGDPILRYEELNSVQEGILLSLAVSVVLCAVILVFCYRSFARALLTVAALFVTLALSTGFAAVAVGTLNLVSTAFVVLLVGLGVDFTIHCLAHLEETVDGTQLRKSLVESCREIGMALALSALTTAAAFLAFVPTEFVGMSQLGVIGSAGVIIAFLVSITFIPAVIMIFPRLATARLGPRRPRSEQTASQPVSLRARPVHFVAAIAFAGLAIASAFVAANVKFDADPMALRDPQSPSMLAVKHLNEDPDTSAYRISYTRGTRHEAEELAAELKEVPGVHTVETLSSFVPEDQDAKLQTIDLAYPTLEALVEGEGLDLSELEEGQSPLEALLQQLKATPTGEGSEALVGALETYEASRTAESDEELERGIFRFYPALIDRFRHQLDVGSVGLGDIPPHIRDRFVSPFRFRPTPDDVAWRIEVSPTEDLSDTAKLREFVDAVSAVDPEISGAPAQVEGAGRVVSRAMLQAALLAGVLVGVICFLAVRSLTTVLAVLVPLVASGIIIAAISALANIPFNYANVIVLPLVIGLGVDSGIHLALRRTESGNTSALFDSSTPRAVFFSGLTTVVAFASLALSAHRGTASMGELLSISIIVTLAGTLALTPLLVDIFERVRQPALSRRDQRLAEK